MNQTTRDHTARIGRYILVGLGSVCVDAGVYWLLFSLSDESILSKATSYIAGALFSYIANWRFTFGKRRSNLSEVAFILIYASSLGINILINEWMLHAVPDVWFRTPFAYLIATAVTTVWNFVGQSLFVFEDTRKEDNLRKSHPKEKALDDQP